MAHGTKVGVSGGRHLVALLLALLLTVAGLLPGAGGEVARAAGCEVTTLDDAGAGSLRAALGNTDGFSNCTAITFQVGLTGTIALASNLPTVANSTVVVTGPTDPGITVDRGSMAPGAAAFTVWPGGDLTLAGLTVTGGERGVTLFAGTATLTGSTVSGNSIGLFFSGGGAATVTNSTLTGNVVGLYFSSGGAATLTNSTLGGNGNGLTFVMGGTAALTNTLLAKGANANCNFAGGGAIAAQTHNLADDNSCFADGANGSIVTVAGATGLATATPQGNGGPTKTFALTTTSPALGAGDPDTCADTGPGKINGVDQRGVPRPQGAGCDIGAYERLPADCVVTSLANAGPGTLRLCLTATEVTAITFQAGLTGTSTLASDLPALTRAVIVTGPGEDGITIDRANKESGIAFVVGPSGNLALTGLTVTGAFAAAYLNNGTATVTSSTLRNNTHGLDFSNGSTATVTSSTLRDNEYGLYFSVDGAATVTNSTISGPGTGLWFGGGGAATVTNSTLSGTGATVLLFLGGGTATLTNTLLSKGTNANCAYDTTLGPVDNTAVTNGGHNLADDATCFANAAAGSIVVPAGQVGLDPAGLQDNGGPTKTIALTATSPALGAGDAATCAATGPGKVGGKDQRGIARPQGSGCDIGAFELVPYHTLTTSTAGSGTGTATPPGKTTPTVGSVVTLTASPAPGSIFVGWTLDGTLVSWKTSVTLTMDADHTVVATFQPMPAFGDVPTGASYADPVAQLAARGISNGCDRETAPPLFCPADPTLRHQMAALIVRAMPGWADETGLPSFTDNTADTELMTRVATLQRHIVVRGYQDEVCQARGLAPPCYGPLDPVTYGQALLFISRAMVAKGYWVLQPDDRTVFPDQNGAVGADPNTDQQTLDHRMVVTYVHYVGNPPDVADVHAPFLRGGVTDGGWADDASRAWFARAFWPALQTYFGQDNLP